MSDRFDYLEIGEGKPVLPAPSEQAAAEEPAWRPLSLRAVEEIGDPGANAGQFAAPTGLAVDRDGALYVADSNNHRVQRITGNNSVYVYGTPGNGTGQLWGPQGVAVDPTGRFLFVAEQGNSRVQCFDVLTGQARGAIGGFLSPSGLCFDAEGKLWIADTGNGRLLRLDTQAGCFIGGIDGASGIVRPIAVCADAVHNIYVTDAATSDVSRYTYWGVRAHALGEIRRLVGPHQAAVDAQGRIYLAEAGANRLHVFDAAGQSLLTFDTPSTRLGPFRSPSGVALGPNGEIYVADTQNSRVLRLAWQ